MPADGRSLNKLIHYFLNQNHIFQVNNFLNKGAWRASVLGRNILIKPEYVNTAISRDKFSS